MRYDLDAFLAIADGQDTVKEAAARLGISIGSVYARAAILRDRGFPVKFLKTRRGSSADAFLAAVTGCTARDAAARLGIGKSTVYARAARLRRRGVAVPQFVKAPRYRTPLPPGVGEQCQVCGSVRTS